MVVLDDPTEFEGEAWKCESSPRLEVTIGLRQTRSFSRDRSVGLPIDHILCSLDHR